jgi:hypothetical protein
VKTNIAIPSDIKLSSLLVSLGKLAVVLFQGHGLSM